MAIAIELLLQPGNVAALTSALDPAVLEAKETDAMLEATQYVHERLYDAYPWGVAEVGSHTKDRFFIALGGTPLELTGVVASPDIAARVIELGRRPGAKPPPPSAIEEWCDVKLGDAKLAYVVARSIGVKGIEARHIFQSVAERVGPAVKGIFVKWLTL